MATTDGSLKKELPSKREEGIHKCLVKSAADFTEQPDVKAQSRSTGHHYKVTWSLPHLCSAVSALSYSIIAT